MQQNILNENAQVFLFYNRRKRLFAGTVPANKNLFAGTVLRNKNLFAETVPANKNLFAGTSSGIIRTYLPEPLK